MRKLVQEVRTLWLELFRHSSCSLYRNIQIYYHIIVPGDQGWRAGDHKEGSRSLPSLFCLSPRSQLLSIRAPSCQSNFSVVCALSLNSEFNSLSVWSWGWIISQNNYLFKKRNEVYEKKSVWHQCPETQSKFSLEKELIQQTIGCFLFPIWIKSTVLARWVFVF